MYNHGNYQPLERMHIFKGGGGAIITWVNKYTQAIMVTYKFSHPESNIFYNNSCINIQFGRFLSFADESIPDRII